MSGRSGPDKKPPIPRRPLGITGSSVFMLLAGLVEVVTGFTHSFFGITTSSLNIFTVSSAAIGLFCTAAGLLILSMRKWAAVLALVLLGQAFIFTLVRCSFAIDILTRGAIFYR